MRSLQLCLNYTHLLFSCFLSSMELEEKERSADGVIKRYRVDVSFCRN